MCGKGQGFVCSSKNELMLCVCMRTYYLLTFISPRQVHSHLFLRPNYYDGIHYYIVLCIIID